VSYVYGAVIVRNNLLKTPLTPTPRVLPTGRPCQGEDNSERRGKSNEKRKEALFGSSIILPDGAALLTWWRVAHWLGRVV
jgi:hypothetical protein